MPDDGPHADDPESAPVEAWLEELAEAEGLSREETIQFLISAYWRLAEIGRLVDDSTDDAGLTKADADEMDVEGVSGLRDQIRHLATDDELGSPLTRFDELADEVRDVSARLEALDGDDDTPHEETLQDLEHRTSEIERQFERIEAELGEINSQLARVYDSTVDQETFSDFVRETSQTNRTLSANQEVLRERISAEFGYLRIIIEHLLDTTTATADRTEQLDSTVVDRLRTHLDEQRQLDQLARTANRRNASTASCSYCSQSVELALLETPACPHCERPVDDISTTTGFLGLTRSHKLIVAGEPARDPDDGE